MDDNTFLKEHMPFVCVDPRVKGTPFIGKLRRQLRDEQGDTVQRTSKYGFRSGYIHVNRATNTTVAHRDFLANKESHSFNFTLAKLLGINEFRITRAEGDEVYASTEGVPDYRRLSSMSSHTQFDLRRSRKEETQPVEGIAEYFVTDRRLLTAEAMKTLWKSPPSCNAREHPDFIPALPHALAAQTERMVKMSNRYGK